MVTKHVKPRRQGEQGGIVKAEDVYKRQGHHRHPGQQRQGVRRKATMAKFNVVDMNGQHVSEIELSDAVFGILSLIHI